MSSPSTVSSSEATPRVPGGMVPPGTDAALFAGLLHVLLRDGLTDTAFCERWVDGVDDLRRAVERYAARYRQPRPNPDRVALRIEVGRFLVSSAFA